MSAYIALQSQANNQAGRELHVPFIVFGTVSTNILKPLWGMKFMACAVPFKGKDGIAIDSDVSHAFCSK